VGDIAGTRRSNSKQGPAEFGSFSPVTMTLPPSLPPDGGGDALLSTAHCSITAKSIPRRLAPDLSAPANDTNLSIKLSIAVRRTQDNAANALSKTR